VGGAVNCLALLDTGTPWAEGDATADADGEAAGLGTLVSPPETWLAELAGVAGTGRVAVGAAGAAVGPHAAIRGSRATARTSNL